MKLGRYSNGRTSKVCRALHDRNEQAARFANHRLRCRQFAAHKVLLGQSARANSRTLYYLAQPKLYD